jgi:hypothetical protein
VRPSAPLERRPWLTLFGAYAGSADPLDQRRLVVAIDGPAALGALSRGRLGVHVTVHAEDIAREAAGAGEVALGPGGLRCRFCFRADDGSPTELVIGQRVDRWTVRRLTELSGSIRVERAQGAVVVAPARLRLDWRGPWRRPGRRRMSA